MGYFSNGTEGLDYQERYYDRCLHGQGKEGCPIMNAHYLYNYDQATNEEVGLLLSTLIPCSKDGLLNEECKLFVVVPIGC